MERWGKVVKEANIKLGWGALGLIGFVADFVPSPLVGEGGADEVRDG